MRHAQRDAAYLLQGLVGTGGHRGGERTQRAADENVLFPSKLYRLPVTRRHTHNAGDTAATSHTEPPTQPTMAAIVAPTAPVFNQTLRALHAERMARQSPAEVILSP